MLPAGVLLQLPTGQRPPQDPNWPGQTLAEQLDPASGGLGTSSRTSVGCHRWVLCGSIPRARPGCEEDVSTRNGGRGLWRPNRLSTTRCAELQRVFWGQTQQPHVQSGETSEPQSPRSHPCLGISRGDLTPRPSPPSTGMLLAPLWPRAAPGHGAAPVSRIIINLLGRAVPAHS